MVSHTGPARLALFLLCCMGTLLSSHMVLRHRLPPRDVRKIVLELQPLSKKLLQDYLNKEMGVPESSRYPLPCFTSDSQQPHSINSRAILPYFKAIRPLLNNTDISEIIQQLDKLKFHHAPETKISVPTDTFECKRFILTILQQFSMCVERTLKSMNSGAQ
ncbi:interleukin-31 [Manis pentadactyla]|uniref:interleukin-31 n=1 Tax=Manis pentadactyla TaxID=143292 RepID=UPI001876E92B|nr:interleukin-31 [Manis pentadactyla]KAI5166286.1 Interleukin-31 [Manis pentadactyla]